MGHGSRFTLFFLCFLNLTFLYPPCLFLFNYAVLQCLFFGVFVWVCISLCPAAWHVGAFLVMICFAEYLFTYPFFSIQMLK